MAKSREKLERYLIICAGCGDTKTKQVDINGREVRIEGWRRISKAKYPISLELLNPKKYEGLMRARNINPKNCGYSICPDCQEIREN